MSELRGIFSIAKNEEKKAVVQELRLQSRSTMDQVSKRLRSYLKKKDLSQEESIAQIWSPRGEVNGVFLKFL